MLNRVARQAAGPAVVMLLTAEVPVLVTGRYHTGLNLACGNAEMNLLKLLQP